MLITSNLHRVLVMYINVLLVFLSQHSGIDSLTCVNCNLLYYCLLLYSFVLV